MALRIKVYIKISDSLWVSCQVYIWVAFVHQIYIWPGLGLYTLNLWRLDIPLHIFTDIAGCFHWHCRMFSRPLHMANLYCKHVLHARAVTSLSFPDHLRLSAIISARTARCIISRRSPRAVAGGGLLRPARCKLWIFPLLRNFHCLITSADPQRYKVRLSAEFSVSLFCSQFAILHQLNLRQMYLPLDGWDERVWKTTHVGYHKILMQFLYIRIILRCPLTHTDGSKSGLDVEVAHPNPRWTKYPSDPEL